MQMLLVGTFRHAGLGNLQNIVQILKIPGTAPITHTICSRAAEVVQFVIKRQIF